MPLRDDLLNPIAGASPAGTDLRYDPIYEKIKEARREDEDIPTGGWDRPRKLADWPQVLKLAGDAIAGKSKDLQLAAWLTEAMLRREGFSGLAAGLTLVRGMMERFWDGCYPEIEDGDLELRAAPLEWLGTKLDLAVKSVPLNKANHDYWKYKESRSVPTEQETEGDEAKSKARAAALEDGRLAPEVFDKSFGDTPKPWYRQLSGDLSGALAALETLDADTRERFGDDAPNLLPLRTGLEEVQVVVQQLLERKLLQDPDPVEAGGGGGGGPGYGASGASGAGGAGGGGGTLAPEPVDANDAAARLIGAARFLRRNDPTSPTSYLMLRALRWGELRAQGPAPDPRLLDAPHAQARTQLKTLLLDSDWPQLLELAETVMGTPAGRGWLDLQRYLLNALTELGQDYATAARAVRRELKTLLSEIPTLPQMTLMDDLPTAGPSTLSWLQSEGLVGEGSEEEVEAPRAAPAAPARAAGVDRVLERALAEVKAGRTPKAMEMIKRELARETSERGRFLRQVQLARVMVEAGLDGVAIPSLQKLVAQIDEHKLEEWEDGKLVAEPLGLLYRALQTTGGDADTRQALYLRICELDPMAAIGFGQARAGEGDGEGA
jgi:type VI secretion system protein ImpA